MRSKKPTLALIAIVTALAAGGTAAQPWGPPADDERCPSKWGEGDERGAANHMQPATVLRAAGLIRTGQVFELGRVLSADMPFVGTRRFELHTKRTFMNAGRNRRGSNEEIVFSEIGQVGTQFDGFSHQTIGNSMYNCFTVEETSTRTGFTRLGVQNVGGLMTRGVLIDVAGLKGVETLPDTYEITPEDLRQALERQGIALMPGDAAIVHTGWGRLWDADPPRYGRTMPGLGVAAAQWLASQDPMLVGADTSGINVSPSPDPELSNPTHQIMLVINGIHLLENLRLDELVAQRVHEFALIVQPLKIQGGTGSTVAPMAIR
jgi:kynurenine formamidase